MSWQSQWRCKWMTRISFQPIYLMFYAIQTLEEVRHKSMVFTSTLRTLTASLWRLNRFDQRKIRQLKIFDLSESLDCLRLNVEQLILQVIQILQSSIASTITLGQLELQSNIHSKHPLQWGATWLRLMGRGNNITCIQECPLHLQDLQV